MKYKININLNFLFLSVFVLLVILYEPLIRYGSNIFNYIDELIVLFFLIISSVIMLKKKYIYITQLEKYIFFIFIFLSYLGILSALNSQLNSITALLIDYFIFSKFLIVYFSSKIIFSNYNYLDYIQFNKKFYLFILFGLLILLLLNIIFEYFPIYDTKYFLDSQSLFFGHPSRLAFASIILAVVLFPLYNNIFIYLSLILGLFSFRTKFFVFIFFISIFLFIKKHVQKLYINPVTFTFIILIITLPILIFREQVIYYFSLEALESGYARAVLFYNSFNIASDYFPLGSGFGTYGSWTSGVYYSEIYHLYNIVDVDGMTSDSFNYISDSYISMVIGQFGYIGVLLFIILIILFILQFFKYFNIIQKKENIKKKLALSGLLILVYSFSAETVSDSILSQNRAVFIFIYLGMISAQFSGSSKIKWKEKI